MFVTVYFYVDLSKLENYRPRLIILNYHNWLDEKLESRSQSPEAKLPNNVKLQMLTYVCGVIPGR